MGNCVCHDEESKALSRAGSMSNVNYPRMSAEGSSFKCGKSQEPLIHLKVTFKKYPTFASSIFWIGSGTLKPFLSKRKNSQPG